MVTDQCSLRGMRWTRVAAASDMATYAKLSWSRSPKRVYSLNQLQKRALCSGAERSCSSSVMQTGDESDASSAVLS